MSPCFASACCSKRTPEFAWAVANAEEVRSTISLPQAVGSVETSTGLLNRDCSAIPVISFLEDHKAETIQRVAAEVERFARANGSERYTFRLFTGNVGVMAATNEVGKDAHVKTLLYICAAVMALCMLVFRSWRGVVCIILPLGLVSILSYAIIGLLGIGLKTST